MWAIITSLGGLGAVLSLAGWAFRAYLAKKNADATAQERQAGRDAQQKDALNAEVDRTTRAADAGAAANGLRDGQADPYDEARK